jgi:hypothetical protein
MLSMQRLTSGGERGRLMWHLANSLSHDGAMQPGLQATHIALKLRSASADDVVEANSGLEKVLTHH